ncbi:hypothetical protein BDV06DRAFT_182626 [Aspergillus oleicola]
MCAGCQGPSACDAERERLRDVAKYYCLIDRPSSDNDMLHLQGDEQPDNNKRIASDAALTGLARLGVLQFGCNRAFVLITDETNQHIIAEATKSVSLYDARKHKEKDGLYIGVRSLGLKWDVLPITIAFFTNRQEAGPVETDNLIANNTRYVVLNFAKEEEYKDRPYVIGWPFMRFYAAVPIKTPAGHVLGSYSIVDDKPRSDFGNTEVDALQEIADAIAQHLETVRLSHCHHRTENLVKSLTTFVKEHDEFDPTESFQDTPTQQGNVTGSLGGDGLDKHGDQQDGSAVPEDDGYEFGLGALSPSENTGEGSSLFSKVTDSEPTEISVPFRNSERTVSASSVNVERRDSLSQNAPVPSNDTASDAQAVANGIATKVPRIFRRASILLRDSMDLDGVLFLDASRCNAGALPQSETGTWEPLPSTLHPGFPADPYPSPMDIPGVGSLSTASKKVCEILGCALMQGLDFNRFHRRLDVSEKLLDDLVTSYPQGHIFDLSDVRNYEPASPSSDTSIDLTRQLAMNFPGANTVLFSPIWDWNKSRWLAGTLVWSSNAFRGPGVDELHYLKAFGDSIISEVARSDWTSTKKSKSAFMSSVSHEMRSPLHGILASAELLATSTLPPEQQGLVDMIEASGMTLLDTLNHLLDFSGINNLAAIEDAATAPSESVMTSLASSFDLGTLVEDVVQVQYTGQTLPKAAVHLNQPLSPPPEDANTSTDELSVIVRVEDRPNWTVHSVPGAWRRIVMNLLGNSLKWTKAGFIEVSLTQAKRKHNSMSFAVLSVTDTGAGIAPDFLRHNVFSPFSQENALSEGLGLGLSTVRQLVDSLDGHLNVQSEIGVGTQVDIFIPVQILEPSPTVPSSLSLPFQSTSDREPVRACLIGFSDYPALKETPTGILPTEAKRKLAIRSCLTTILSERTEWNISSSESLNESEGDVAIIEETMFQEVLRCRQRLPADGLFTGFKKIFVILNSKESSRLPEDALHVIRVSQPFGCRKFRKAVTKVDKLLQTQRPKLGLIPLFEAPPPHITQSSPSAISGPAKSEGVQFSAAAGSTPSIPVQKQASRPSERPDAPHILIVDDNQINLKVT